MKFQLKAGGEIDLLTKAEVFDVLKSWQAELTRGARIRNYTIQGVVDGGGNLLMGDNRDGPEPGMVWGITRFSVVGSTIPPAGIAVYRNEVARSTVMIANLQRDLFPDARGCMLFGGDSLRVAGGGLVATDQVTVTMSIREVPAAMAWSL